MVEWSVVCRASQGMEVELPIRWMCARQEDVLGGREAFRVEPGGEEPWEQAGLGPQAVAVEIGWLMEVFH